MIDGRFTKTITGFRYLVDELGTGVTIRDVGRIVYGDLDELRTSETPTRSTARQPS